MPDRSASRCGKLIPGDLVGIQHDVGIFELPDGRRYLIAMFTGDLENDSAGIAAISQVSLAVYQALRD